MNLTEKLFQFGVVPILTLKQPADAEPVCRALLKGELPVVEVTFRAAGAAESIDAIARLFPEMLVGAGTVLTLEQAQQAVDAGALFLVSPGFDPNLAAWCQERSLPFFPGVATPTEIQMALQYNLNILKFFPAEPLGGVRMLEALRGPFGQVRFLPTGGIGPNNAADYLRLPNVLAVGGSWMVKPELIAHGDFDTIARLTQEARNIARTVRG